MVMVTTVRCRRSRSPEEAGTIQKTCSQTNAQLGPVAPPMLYSPLTPVHLISLSLSLDQPLRSIRWNCFRFRLKNHLISPQSQQQQLLLQQDTITTNNNNCAIPLEIKHQEDEEKEKTRFSKLANILGIRELGIVLSSIQLANRNRKGSISSALTLTQH